MSLYREPGRERRRRRLIAAAAVAAVIAVAVIVVLVAGGGDGTPSASDRASSARTAAGQALDRLELLEIEYAQAAESRGAASEYVGATGHIKAAREEIDGHAADLKAVEGWLQMNLGMLQTTIQGLEMQRSTLAAMQAAMPASPQPEQDKE